MDLIVLSVVVIALFIAVLAICLFALGGLLNRIADNLDDCLNSVQQIDRNAKVIGPGVTRLNETGTKLVGAMPLLYGGAETLVAKSAPPAPSQSQHVGYMDLDAPEPAPVPQYAGAASGPVAAAVGVGYMDS
jgi:hypothetical protein